MKTWQMIKVLTENPELEAKSKDGSTISVKEDGCIQLKYNGFPVEISGNIRITESKHMGGFADEWEFIQQPVPFIQALNSGKRVKPIIERPNYDYSEYRFVAEWLDSKPLTINQINGLWLIEL